MTEPLRETGCGLEHAERREPHRPAIWGICRCVHLGDVDAAHPWISRERAREGPKLVRLDTAGDRGRAARRHRAITDVDVEIYVDRPAAGSRDRECLGGDLPQGPIEELVTVDHRDAPLLRALAVGAGVREVCDADLHDVARIESSLDEASHR